MCDFIPLIFTCGCDRQLSQESGQAHICPRCHNGTVFPTKERNCFTFCFVPLIPLGSSHIYHCSTCQWEASQSGPAPPVAPQPGGFYGPGQMGGAPGYGGGGYGGGQVPMGGYVPQQGMGYPQQQPPQGGYH
ncbi:hypothetical protein NBRC10512_007822 [Rhodotorula toruloides]|uniref:RHTO0S01e18206g1_1 n=2 Tax=Rhodotorula toruloides TaxID=5286 RepID=A0A061AFB2_RHOTO|nr:uncharacterized protein RHTO_04239 [Rhodotorula toruloides NP11]EMS19704.1 hypothetical protein RHTO_04239 [Rhodotorula toruloides NP11]CDR36281.1 RHTO0S01e18206g1_1 [Rhodotorula toruloides]